MSVAVADGPQLLHAIPGRARIHLSGWSGQGRRKIESHLRALPGVLSAEANPATGNALIRYDPTETDEQDLLAAARALQPQLSEMQEQEPPAPPATRERRGQTVRARIAVRGLDRDPHLARRVVERLQRTPGVRALANPLTGRVLVEFKEYEADLDDLIAQVADIEMPETLDEDRPADPLDPRPLFQSATRAIGSALGLGILGAQQLPGVPSPLLDQGIASTISGILGILRGFPLIRNGVRKLIGRNAADLAFSLPNIATTALSNSALGLLLNSAEALRIYTEVNARRTAWQRYEAGLAGTAAATPGAIIRVDTGERTPMAARVIEGTGSAIGRSGTPLAVAPDGHVPAGARLFGGPFVLELEGGEAFIPQPRPAPLAPTLYDRYQQMVSPLSLAYAALTAVLTRSIGRTFIALLLVNPRVAVIGMEAANLDATARVLRAGVIAGGTRPERVIRLPNAFILDGPRLISDHFEIANTLPLSATIDTAELLALAGGIAAAAGSPWGGAFRAAHTVPASNCYFDGTTATAKLRDETYHLGPPADWSAVPQAATLRQRGAYVLEVRSEREEQPLGLIALRARLAPEIKTLVQVCRRHGVMLEMLPGEDELTAQGIAERAHIPLLRHDDAIAAIRSRQANGEFVAFVSDGAHAAAAFEASDLGIGVTGGHNPIAARADLIAPDLGAIVAIIEAGAARDKTVRDSVGFSAITNVIGAVWGFRGAPGVEVASNGTYIGALAALADGWLRLRGGERKQSLLTTIKEPHPEQWGERDIESVLSTLNTSEDGLTSAQAAQRRRAETPLFQRRTLLNALADQLRSPLTGLLAAGAGISLLLGAPADVIIIGATIAANALIGTWQEYRANQVTETLKHLGAASARLLRDGQEVTVSADEVVPGDVLLLGPGDRVTADARLIQAQNLEVDEAALTGESLPVPKSPTGGSAASRIVLDGSDITTGTARAIAVAVGRNTRMGTISAALMAEKSKGSPLDARLAQLFQQILPLAIAGGGIVTASGFLRTRSLLPTLAVGSTIALAALPEGLPLLTQVSEASVARRLATRNALTRRLPAVEALGRVDVACTDKTGTLTQGHLSLNLLASADGDEARLPGELSDELRAVLLTAALASPHPDAADATAHPTDIAVTTGAEEAGLGSELEGEREAESSFDPVRAFHATRVHGRLCVKGAPEVLVPRCSTMRRHGRRSHLTEPGREKLLARAQELAERGLRVLMVAEGPADASTDNPRDLTALGFLGISDPLKPDVRAAVRRCHEAGVRVIMLTGDHPATARAIAHEAGLLNGAGNETILTGREIAELHNGDLDAALEQATVIARATPLDKVRIVESLRRSGHTVAMTGDGVNDAPALRLADIGVAMGRNGTEVARQTADVVLADDDFTTLVETFVEGRSFWLNMRRAIALLLGGNLGELGLVVAASALGSAAPLSARQILVVNMITDILPGLAVALQQPEHRNLADLAREGSSALDRPLRNDVLRRGVLTAGPSLAAYLLALSTGSLPLARTVAFANVITTQLAQTLDVGYAEGRLTPPVVGAVSGSAALLGAGLLIPPLRTFLGLTLPTPLGWALIGGGTLTAFLLSRLTTAYRLPAPSRPTPRLLAAPGVIITPAEEIG